MPEPPPAASTANRDHRPIPPRRSPAPDGAGHHRLPVRHPAAHPAAPPVAAGAARPRALRLLRQRPHHRNHQLVTLERVCDEVLGWHPRMPYDKVLRPSHPPTPAGSCGAVTIPVQPLPLRLSRSAGRYLGSTHPARFGSHLATGRLRSIAQRSVASLGDRLILALCTPVLDT